jgi:hypothetical protein
MSTGKQVTLNYYGLATITRVAGGFRVVADGGASANFRLIDGDIVVDSYENCSHGYMHAALASAWSAKNYVAPASAPVTVSIPMSREAQLAYDAGMSDLIQQGVDRQLRATAFGAR